jgi:hypothetical protein
MVYFAMALALFVDEDYEEVAARLTETLAWWGCWDDSWSAPASGGITQARRRLGAEPLELLFGKVAAPVAGVLTRGAFLRHWRLMAKDGFELDVPDTAANAAAFGYPAGAREHPAFPKVRVVTIGECGSHAKVAGQLGPVGGKGTCEQALARRMFGRLQEDWLLIADRGFYNWPDWQAAAAARVGEHLGQSQAMRVRVIEYDIPDRDGDGSGELIALITTITDPAAASAQELAEAYCQRWEEETGNDQLKTCLRGPGAVLRSKSPDMVRQEIYGYLLARYAISALICRAATEAGIDPDRVKFLRTVRVIRRRAADPAFPPDQRERLLAAVMADITSPRNLNPRRRHRSPERLAADLAALDPILARLPLREELGEPPSRPATAWLRLHHEHY